MNELNREAEIGGNELSSVPPLDAPLTELIAFVLTCEAAAHGEGRVEAAIRHARS